MRKCIWIVALMFVACLSVQAQEEAAPATEKAAPFATEKETVSYGLGLQYGRSIKTAEVELNVELLIQGINDGLSGAEPKLSQEQIDQAMMNLRQQLMEKQSKQMQEMAEKNKAASETFLAENAKKEGVTTLPSGLQYKVIEQGTGATPGANDTVTVHYTGTLPDGKVFDSSVERGEPATFGVGQVIPGWTEALQKMKVGDKWQIVIPSELAYGDMGAGGEIGPNQVLIFEVQLMDVKKAPEEKPVEEKPIGEPIMQ